MVRVNPNYIKRHFSGNRTDQMEWYFSINRKYAVIEDYEQFLFVHETEAESAEFKKHRSIRRTDFLIEHPMDDEVKEFLSKLYSTRVPDSDKINVKEYRAFTFFKKFGKGGGSVENDCLRFAESLSIGKYPYRGSRSFMKDNITENLIGESYERNFQIANEIYGMMTRSPYSRSPYNRVDVYNNINSFADPEVGECYGMLSLWSPEEREAMPYHFGCVLFKDINDRENAVSNITLEANVGDQSLQLPNFHIYDVGNNPLNTNSSFYTAWRDSFISNKHPIIKLVIKTEINNSTGETIVTKRPLPPSNATESYDKWGFLMKDGDYVLTQKAEYPIVVVAVPKNKNINPHVNIIPKPFEKESLTPGSPAPSPITSPDKLPFIPSPPQQRGRRTAAARKPPKAATTAATASSAARTRRRSAATTRRQQGRTRTVRTARNQNP